ncbi:DUF4249 domain-containing protein [Pontibacter akesuensis]|uniref:DUF4249 domain-containing protein n=1 Tax=Pontibacter akesuensis TaxID=388950 RepID=A0A1I7K405_9BACT|nr:DUF4249 domain-containing protein [Pontibacter akesuensis]GHA75249.1 hypothetical protein GCM10007389_31380 [Pontibacter akesuensis]SFU92148.1 protein of unknown function [Pontibacter akesuensis]
MGANKYTSQVISFLLCLCLLGCEMVQEVDIPPHQPKLTLRAILDNSGQRPAGFYDEDKVYIGMSQGILESDNLQGVDNATVRLYNAAGQVVEEYAHKGVMIEGYRSLWGVYMPVSGFQPLAGETYTMRAEAPGFEPIEATTSVPALPVVTAVSFDEREAGDLGYGLEIEGTLRLTIQDKADEKNFYRVRVYALDSAYQATGSTAYSIDPDTDIELGNTEEVELNSLFSDEFYTSGIISFSSDIRVFSYGFEKGTGKEIPVKYLEVQVTQVTKEEYLFQKTLQAQNNTEGNPFAEYSNVYSNVKNGYGVLSGMSITRVVVELQE